MLNRNLALALNKLPNNNVSIYITEGLGDYVPDPRNLDDKPQVKELWMKSKRRGFTDVTEQTSFLFTQRRIFLDWRGMASLKT